MDKFFPLQVDVVHSTGAVHDSSRQTNEPARLDQCRWRQARGALAHPGATSPHTPWQTARMHDARGHFGAVRRLFAGRQRVLFRSTPKEFQLDFEFLSNGQAAFGRRDVRVGVQRRSRILGRRRTVPGVVLPAQIPSAQGARPRRDAQGGGESATARGRRIWRRSVRAIPEVFVGTAGKAEHEPCG